jgi:SAM-dependent methyltransferase
MLLEKKLYRRHTPRFFLDETQKSAIQKFEAAITEEKIKFEESICLCGSSQGVLIANYDRYSIQSKTYLCKNCGMLRTNPRLDCKSLSLFYKSYYRSIYVGQSRATESFFFDQISHGQEIYELVSLMFTRENCLVIDIGCGAGGTLVPFKENGWRVAGCDVGISYLQYGLDQGLSLEEGETDTLKKYGKADLVILSHVLEHFPEPLKSLLEISELLCEGGYLYIELPGIFKVHRTYGSTLMFLQNAHLYHFTLTSLTFLLSNAGFELIKGDEYIHAIFQKKRACQKTCKQNQYYQVLFYLQFTEILRKLGLIALEKVLRRFAKKIISKVFRMSVTKKLKEIL